MKSFGIVVSYLKFTLHLSCPIFYKFVENFYFSGIAQIISASNISCKWSMTTTICIIYLLVCEILVLEYIENDSHFIIIIFLAFYRWVEGIGPR